SDICGRNHRHIGIVFICVVFQGIFRDKNAAIRLVIEWDTEIVMEIVQLDKCVLIKRNGKAIHIVLITVITLINQFGFPFCFVFHKFDQIIKIARCIRTGSFIVIAIVVIIVVVVIVVVVIVYAIAGNVVIIIIIVVIFVVVIVVVIVIIVFVFDIVIVVVIVVIIIVLITTSADNTYHKK